MTIPICLRPSLRHAAKAQRTLSLLRRSHSTSSVSADELSHFSALASSWWDPMGPSRVLHLMNPVRHDFIASCLSECPPRPHDPSATAQQNHNNLRYLDIGCGGGIFAESLARTITHPPTNPSHPTPTRAESITAIDPSTTLIKIARDHARTDPAVNAHLQTGRFKYQNRTLEDLISEHEQEHEKQQQQTQQNQQPATTTEAGKYDVITLFEVLEHIDPSTSSPLSFLTNCLRLLRPGGWLIGSTISRSLPSFIVNQVIAEAPWPIGVVPRGTHEWSKFVNADEVKGWVEEGLMRTADGRAQRAGGEALQGMQWKCSGVMYFPGLGWKIVDGSEDWGNYFWAVRRGV